MKKERKERKERKEKENNYVYITLLNIVTIHIILFIFNIITCDLLFRRIYKRIVSIFPKVF